MGNVTDLRVHKRIAGDPGAHHYLVSFKGSASYATYGDTITANQIGANWFLGATPAVGYNSSGNALYIASFYTPLIRGEGAKTGKWVIAQLSDGAEVANTTDLSAITFQALMHGA